MSPLDPAILRALDLTPSTVASVQSHGGSGFTATSKITIDPSSTSSDASRHYFIKMASGPAAVTMFAGEHASLSAMHAVVPSLCPASYGAGALDGQKNMSFLVTEFLEFGGRASDKDGGSGMSLAAKLGKLHTTPAPTPEGYDRPMFGFPVTTCCGDTPQPNEYMANWADFYAENRLRAIYKRAEQNHGPDAELKRMVDRMADTVAPRLLGQGHLGGSEGITPVVVHGDLWAGNRGTGRIGGKGAVEEIVFDPSSCYAHSEFELGIMRMFGGFGGSFMREYHNLVSKSKPVAEYEDRVDLYEL
jgi:protein-ribulosamine 3-kinase